MKSNTKIRKATKDDLEQIFQIEEEVFKPMNYPMFVLRQFYDILPDYFFIAINDFNQIKGYCFGGIDQKNEIGWVFALAVTKENQKKKIGQRVTTELLKEFEKNNINTIQLTTTPDNNAAINLYKKLGFKKVKEVKDYYFDNSPRLIMRLDII